MTANLYLLDEVVATLDSMCRLTIPQMDDRHAQWIKSNWRTHVLNMRGFPGLQFEPVVTTREAQMLLIRGGEDAYTSVCQVDPRFAPEWILKAFAEGVALWKPRFDGETVSAMRHLIDMLIALYPHRDSYANISIVAAQELARQWDEYTKRKKLKAGEGQTKDLLVTPDYKLVECLDLPAFEYEGKKMSHCVANYWHANPEHRSRIISVRQAEKHVATVEVRDNVVVQIQGPSNAALTQALSNEVYLMLGQIGIQRGGRVPELERVAGDNTFPLPLDRVTHSELTVEAEHHDANMYGQRFEFMGRRHITATIHVNLTEDEAQVLQASIQQRVRPLLRPPRY